MVRNAVPPGPKGKRRHKGLSEYGKELKDKQELKNWYNLSEKQFRNYVTAILGKHKTSSGGGKAENASELLIRKLELRLDNVILRLGFATSRVQARSLVTHGHFLVNDKPVKIPSHELRKGDKISLKKSSSGKRYFQIILPFLKRHVVHSWLSFDIDKLEGKVVNAPNLEEASPPVPLSAIFEFYSR